jgi:hypothetical protein
MRFDMARTLVKRAHERADWIGDDHGDPYEDAPGVRRISDEMKIALKEILDHLRAALDYCAREVCERCVGHRSRTFIYFPIVARGFDPKDFRSRLSRLMLGLLKTRPDLEPIFASF